MTLAKMNWGLICSIENSDQVGEFQEFGKWMVNQLELAARRMRLGHSFAPSASFTMYATPGLVGEVTYCYERIGKVYPEVNYVIHVLPSKDSIEFDLLKKMTVSGALIGQGVLAENALNHFERYQLDEVMCNMNQWISRRLSQILARQSENSKDRYRMVVTNSNSSNNNNGAFGSAARRSTPTAAAVLYSEFRPHQRTQRSPPNHKQNQQYWQHKRTNAAPTAQDLDYSVGVVLHKENDANIDQPAQPYSYRKQETNENDRENEVVVKGFPSEFNKFQIASLFFDFRPRHIEYRGVGEAVVQFANKFHAAQVARNYNGQQYEDESFTLEVNYGCGYPCPPCKENCLNVCEHRECEMKCDDICNVPPCNEPCRKLLKCAPKPDSDEAGNVADVELHRCIGLCGEDCIQLCRICEPENFAEQVTEVFFGTEDEDGARFVQLKDCGDILEFSGLDHWIEQQTTDTSSAIVQITCPKCKTPIRRSKRYVHLLNKRANQIELIKQKIIGQPKNILIAEWKAQQMRVNDQLIELIEKYQFAGMPELRRFSQRMEDIKDHLMKKKKNDTQMITSQWMATMGNVEKILDEMQKIVSDVDRKQRMTIADPKIIDQLTAFKIDGLQLKEYLLVDLIQLLDRLHGPGKGGAKITTVSESVLVQLSSELARNNFLLELFAAITEFSLDVQQQEILHQILIDLHNGRSFFDNREELDNLLKQLANRIPDFCIFRRELVQINRALSSSAFESGQWYICSKGHPYSIGDCGRAMVKSECPECHEVIGGQQLVGTSRTAP